MPADVCALRSGSLTTLHADCVSEVSCTCCTTCYSQQHDEPVLQDFYNMCSGLTSSNWFSEGVEMCNFDYVTCVNGRVSSLALNGLLCYGHLPASIGQLTYLTTLNLV